MQLFDDVEFYSADMVCNLTEMMALGCYCNITVATDRRVIYSSMINVFMNQKKLGKCYLSVEVVYFRIRSQDRGGSIITVLLY